MFSRCWNWERLLRVLTLESQQSRYSLLESLSQESRSLGVDIHSLLRASVSLSIDLRHTRERVLWIQRVSLHLEMERHSLHSYPCPTDAQIGKANPTWGDIFESSQLKARTSLLSCFSEKRRLSFELWALKQHSKMSPQVGSAVSTYNCCIYIQLL